MNAWLRLLGWARALRRGSEYDTALSRQAVWQLWENVRAMQPYHYYDYHEQRSITYTAAQRSASAANHLGQCDECSAAVITGYERVRHVAQERLACTTCDKCINGCCECVPCSGCDARLDTDDHLCRNCECCSDCCECASCNGCSRTYSRDSSHWCSGCTSASNDYVCERCCDGSCRQDESSDSVEFFTLPVKFHDANRLQRKLNTSGRYIAAEIEVAQVDSDDGVSSTVRKWGGSIVQDASLPSTGFEINTAPARGDVFVRQVKEICAALRASGAEVNSKCGLHVHVDAKDLNHYELQRVVRLYAALEPLFFDMVPSSRRNNRYCEPCGEQYLRGLTAMGAHKGYLKARRGIAHGVYGEAGNTRGRKRSKYDQSRYAALNLHSWFYRGTLECRMFGGTCDADKIIAWGMLWANLIDAACKLTDAESLAIVDTCRDSVHAQYDVLMRRVVGSASYAGQQDSASAAYLKDFVHKRLRLCATNGFLQRVASSESNAEGGE